MADEKVTIAFVMDDRITKALKGIGDEIEDTGDEATKANRKVGALEQGFGKLKGALGAVGGMALKGVTAGAAAAAAAVTAAAIAANKAREAWGEQSAAVGAAADALARAGVPADELAGRLDELNTVAGDLAGKTLFGDEAIFEAAARYTKLTGDATVGTRELDTILGIAAGTQRDAADAAEIYAKAQKGDIGALKDLTPLTVTQEKELAKLEGTTKQAELATALLEAQYAGLAQQTDPTTQSISNLTDAFGDNTQAIGGVINESGALSPVLDAITSGFRLVEQAVYDNSVELQQGLITATKGAVSMLIQLATWVNENASLFGQALVGVKLLGGALNVVGKVVGVVANAIRTGLSMALSGLMTVLSEVMLSVSDLAGFVGEDGLARDFKSMGDSLAESSTQFSDSAANGFSATQDSLIGLEGALKDIPSAAEGYEENVARIEATSKSFEGTLRGVNDQLTNARANVQKLSATSGGLNRTRTNAPPGDDTKREREEMERKAKAEKAAAERKKRDDALNAANALEFQNAEIARLDKIRKLEEERLERARELSDIMGELAGVTTGIGAVDGLSAAFIGLAEANEMSRETAAEAAKADKARVNAIQGVGHAAAGAAEAIGASEAAVSAIKAIAETAAAASATGLFLSTGNPSFLAAAGQHAFAAATHAVVAGTSVAGSPAAGGGGGPSGSSAATRGGGLSVDPQDIARINAEAIAEALGGGGAGTVIINLDSRGSVGDMTNDAVRKVGEAAVLAFDRRGMRASNLLMRRTG
jgi:hypothetical protein